MTSPIFCRKRVCFVVHFSLESCCALNLRRCVTCIYIYMYIYIYTLCIIHIYSCTLVNTLYICLRLQLIILITRFSPWRNDSLGFAWSPVAGCVEVRSANPT